MRMTIYEGTPDEILQIQRGLEAEVPQSLTKSASSQRGETANSASYGKVPISFETAYDAITRRELLKAQQKVIKILYDADINWTFATVLQKAIGYTPSQFAGFMGALGRRFTHSKGYKQGMWFFEQEWDMSSSCFKYRLPSTVRQAAEKAKIV